MVPFGKPLYLTEISANCFIINFQVLIYFWCVLMDEPILNSYESQCRLWTTATATSLSVVSIPSFYPHRLFFNLFSLFTPFSRSLYISLLPLSFPPFLFLFFHVYESALFSSLSFPPTFVFFSSLRWGGKFSSLGGRIFFQFLKLFIRGRDQDLKFSEKASCSAHDTRKNCMEQFEIAVLIAGPVPSLRTASFACTLLKDAWIWDIVFMDKKAVLQRAECDPRESRRLTVWMHERVIACE